MYFKVKKLFIFFCFVYLCGFKGHAQTFGNEWINYNQNYYKFPILGNGIYRINYNALQNAGIPIASINPKNIQIFDLKIHISRFLI